MVKKLNDLEILNLILKSKQFLNMPFGIHGRAHACRVFVFANTLSNLIKDKSKIDTTAIIISSLLHDCGRSNDGKDIFHGVNSSEKAIKFIEENNITCNKELIKECIIRHCPPPNYKNNNPSIESKLIGDADKLDRFRFHKQNSPCKDYFLELKESKSLMDISSRINGHKWRSFKK
ncbi:MAG: HD domain-containing protein [Candidatus Pacearchaeota archaeon]